MSILVSADFLREIEKLCWAIGATREQFDHMIFAKGIDVITNEARQNQDDDFQAELAMLGRLGMKMMKNQPEF